MNEVRGRNEERLEDGDVKKRERKERKNRTNKTE